MPAAHREFLTQALPALRADARLEGVAACGSFVTGVLDEQSDLDLVVVSAPEVAKDVLRGGRALAARLGPLLEGFPGDHVGEPRLLICLYGPPLLHVDLKFVAPDELAPRVEEPRVLWDRRGVVRAALAASKAVAPAPRFQWMEDRFWIWAHYVATKIARGELFEAVDALTFVRACVLGPLTLADAGARPTGVRRLEAHAPAAVARLSGTVPSPDRAACQTALLASVDLYTDLRERVAPPTLVRNPAAERAVRDFLRSM
jgi:predicted nucleotidyltransferase